jgi:class 3 adenylate cyclase
MLGLRGAFVSESLFEKYGGVIGVHDIVSVFYDRIKTLGDSYIAVSGLPVENDNHMENVARAALSFLHYINQRNRDASHKWHLRIGLAIGPIIGSIVGIQKFVFDVFGMPVNLGARLEAISEPDQITVPLNFASLLDDSFVVDDIRTEAIKGIGEVEICRLSATP